MNAKTASYRLVYALSIHPELGNLIEAYAVKLNPDKSFSLSFNKVNSQNLKTELYSVDATDLKIVDLIDQYSDEKIVKRFSKKVVKFSDFWKKIEDKKFVDQLRPYIEKRLSSIYQLISHHHIPLYFKGEKKEHIKDKAITFLKKQTDIVFNFSRTDEDLTYHLSIRNGKEPIKLFEKDLHVICSKPAVIILENQLHHFNAEVDSNKFKPFINKEFVHIPKDKEKQYFKSFIYNSIRKHEVNPEGFSIQLSTRNPTPKLHISKNWQDIYVFNLEFDYGVKSIAANDLNNSFVELKINDDDYQFVKHIRLPEFENNIKSHLTKIGLRLLENASYVTSDNLEKKDNSLFNLLAFLNQHEVDLAEKGIPIIQAEEEVQYFTGKIDLEISFNEKPDWFDMHAVVKFNTYEIPFIRLRKNIVNGIREYKLPDGSIAILPEEWFAEYRDVLAFAEKSDGEIKIKKQFFNVLETVPGFESDFKTKFKALNSPESLDKLQIPSEIQAQLRPYQKTGYSWMNSLAEQNFGCCLADDMGLGKTLQALALLQKHQHINPIEDSANTEIQLNLFTTNQATDQRKTSLIIMPTSLLYNWANEIQKFAPKLRFYVHEGGKRGKTAKLFKYYDIIISSYGLVRNDIEIFKDIIFNFVILDESQFIKNADSKGFKAVMQLQANHRITLTGTPIENSLSDLWSQMSFINPGILGDKRYFKQEFIKPIEKQHDELAAEKLKRLIGPFILRRTKSEVAKDLPSLTEQIHYCTMTDAHHSYYEEKKSQIRNLLLGQVKSGDISQKMIAVLKALMQLRLIANHPLLVDPEYQEDSGKFNEIIRFMNNAQAGDHKTLMFSSFVKHLNLFAAHQDEMKNPYLFLSGKTKSLERKNMVDKFQKDANIKSFLVSIKAGGVGLNLTAADYIFILDPWWNPAVESQAINRAHRIGQDKKVFAYKFITKDSIEEKILNLQRSKKGLADTFINSNNPLRSMNKNEIEELFE
ncbi:MAG: ATP-dependent helicase [Bacteroidetes bacterium]|nr:ATP-dependent helicase [Bacteroidota bacterium]